MEIQMTSLSDVSNGAIRELIGNRSISRTLFNLQNATATYDGVTEPDGIMIVSINGFLFNIADVTNKAMATLAALQHPITGRDTYYSQPVSTTVYYTVVVNAAGTFYAIQGTYAGQVITGNGANGIGDGSIPDIAVKGTYAPVAVFKVVNGVTAVFIPATTNWDATNVTSSAAAVAVLPRSAADLTFTAGGA
jgi:hypothetical protein